MERTELVDGYLEARGSRKDSPHTTAAYRSDLETVMSLIGEGDLSLQTMRKAFNEFASTREASSVRRAWSTWNGFFDHLVHEGVVEGNPMAGVAKPSATKRAPRSFDAVATERILASLVDGAKSGRDPWPELDLAVITTLLLTGVRSSELRGLDIGSLSGTGDDKRLVVRGKGGSDRVVPVEPTLVAILAGYQESRLNRFPTQRREGNEVWQKVRPESAMFVGRDGERLTRGRLQYLVSSVYRRAGVNSERQRGALVHALRHTFATRLIESPETSVVQLMELLGHRSMATTQVYVAAAGREVRAVAAANPIYRMVEDVSSTTSDGQPSRVR